MKNLLYILLILSVVLMPAAVMADEAQPDAVAVETDMDEQAVEVSEEDAVSPEEEAAWEEEVAGLPPMHYTLEPEINTWLGGRVVDVNGANRAMEFGWPHSSVSGGFKLHYSPLPHRFDAELDMLNQHDYQTEFSYAYKDIVKLSYIGLGLWHNLDHFQPVATFDERGGDDVYHAAVHDNRQFLRLKWPDRAFHVFGEFRQFGKDGVIQKRFYTNTAASVQVGKKHSQSRDIDWVTRQYRAGANGHFGPVEIEYAHRIKTFNAGGVTSMVDSYNSVPAVHATVPDLETNEDVVKLHTDLTGRVVGSATFVNGEKENNNSKAGVDYRRAYADVTLIPAPNLTVALRYRYLELETSTPDTTPAPTVRATKEAIDSRTNRAELAVRYSPTNSFAVKAEYDFDKKERYDQKNWYWWDPVNDPANVLLHDPGIHPIPAEMNVHTFKLGVDLRPSRAVKAKGSVEYLYSPEQDYAIKPRTQFTGRFDIGWTPTTSVAADVYYRITRAENNNAEMRLSKDNIGALVAWSPAERLNLNASYDYARYKKTQEMEFELPPFPPLVPPFGDHVTNRDTSHMYTLGADYGFSFPLTLSGEFRQSWSRGRFRTSVANPAGVSTSFIGPLTNLKIRETGGGLTAKYAFRNGWGAEASYNLNNYQDMQDQPQDGDQDGTAQAVLVLLTRNW